MRSNVCRVMSKLEARAASLADGNWSHRSGPPGPISSPPSKFPSSSADRTNRLVRALADPENDIRGNPGSAHRTLIRREAGVGDPLNERDI